ncbi:copper resistance system multicopper oxidase [Candidatus Nitrospira inopinata]|jgi:CopA family copper-resistance protein|uniref:Copper resistance protein A n=1 Tax=Candidatus Nitrospira inopinata TaxID=1715989 RepID=A0A0S4KUM0_9BACT|nr:copper resistance system multicopper oxidase [Candidatus Nitrospira inopinata]CUQ65346.1 Copper resistance protein A [Candidatus Nitrospira inopinata]
MRHREEAEEESGGISRRLLLKRAGALGLLAAIPSLLAACAGRASHRGPSAGTQPSVLSGELIDLVIGERSFTVDGRAGTAVTINGTVPGPLLRLQEGQEVTIRVTNHLREPTSIHWHGILLPFEMDGVPGVSFAGIEPGESFTYRFPVQQNGTYWYHSHSGGQELKGMYGPLIIEPREPEPVRSDRDYVVLLSDWSVEEPETILANLKKTSGYYNFQKRTAVEFVSDVRRMGFWPALQDYLLWDWMRMDPTDFADVTGSALIYLLNGLSPSGNWTGLFQPGESVRLRLINAAATTFFDVRVPGLAMRVVQADGQNVQPVTVEELRMGPAETYDVIVRPEEDRAYTIFAEAMDRSGYARGTLAPRPGMSGDLPPRRPRPLRTMDDMGMGMKMEMEGMIMAGMDAGRDEHRSHGMAQARHGSPGHSPDEGHAGHGHGMVAGRALSGGVGMEWVRHGPDDHGTGNQMVAEYARSRLMEPGTGLDQMERRVLVYTDLKRLAPMDDRREPERSIELHLTGHMVRYLWSFDGRKYSEAPAPIPLRDGERLRLVFVNDTMMEHPIHLHGMWMELENGAGEFLPRKHTVIVKPAERLSVAVTVDAPGRWALHCHLLLHMEAGMFRVVEVAGGERNSPS